MSHNQLLTFAAVALIAGLWGYRRGVAVGATQAGPADPFASAGGTAFLNWQAQ